MFSSEEELRADPAYANYYYSNANPNPRLPPPLVSKEDWRFSQRRNGESSLFSMQLPVFEGKEDNGMNHRRSAAEWGGNGFIGMPPLGLGSRQRSFADILQVSIQSFLFLVFLYGFYRFNEAVRS